MSYEKENDFGRDSIPLLVLKFNSFMFAQFVNVLYSIVDRIYIGNIPVIGADCWQARGYVPDHYIVVIVRNADRYRGFRLVFGNVSGREMKKALSRYWQTVFLCCFIFREY